MTPRTILLNFFVWILLALFLLLLGFAFMTAYDVVSCGANSPEGCVDKARALFTPAMEMGFGTVGGLLSATVVAVLAIAAPNEVPGAKVFSDASADTPPSRASNIASGAYLLVWAVGGLAAYLWGSLFHADALKALTAYGNAWFGLAIAAGYAYFGLSKKTSG